MDDDDGKNKRMKMISKEMLIVECQSWAGSNGLVMVTNDGSWQHAPVSFTPASFPRAAFQRAIDLAVPFNELVDCVSRDSEYLQKALEDAIRGDSFTKQLVDVYNKYGGKKARQQIYLGIHRSDYMIDASTQRLLQIELNTISSSFACLSARVTKLHQHLLTGNPTLRKACAELDDRFVGKSAVELSSCLPNNLADIELPKALAMAHSVYKPQQMEPESVYVLFIVQDGERNYVDQRLLEYELMKTHKVSVIRRTLLQIIETGKVIEPSGALIVDGDKEISVAYFRAGYTPTDYPTAKQWEARELIESSLAIKCPSVAYHLVGAKKIQQRLADPGVLEKFISDESTRVQLRSCFAGLWSMGSDFDPEVRKRAIEHYDRYVVKPQREGGGNNLYGINVQVALQTMLPQELAAHILMERIFPPREPAYLMRNASVDSGPALSELGIYSIYLGDGNKCYLNQAAGHLLRTKFDGVDEGGVASGFSSLNSPFLV